MLTLALAVALTQYPQHRLFRQADLPSGSSMAFFEFAPVSGAGMPSTACSTTAPTGARGEALVFSRSTGAWCTNDDYSLTFLSANQPRIMRGRPGAPLGILIEEDGQNDFLNNRDLSQTTTTKTSMTCAKTATGVDGVANSASTCTASGANGTALQAIVRASAANASSLYIRRRTGSGAVQVTRDNGTTWNAITSSVDTNWKRVVCRDTEGCMGGRCIIVPDMCATSANPTVGIRLVTSGDAVDVDLVQNESSPLLRPSSPITTAGTAGTRGYDAPPYVDKPAFTVGSMRFSLVHTVHGNNEYGIMLSNGAAGPFVTLYSATAPVDNFNNVGCLISTSSSAAAGVSLPPGGVAQSSCTATSSSFTNCHDGRCTQNVTPTVVPTTTRIYIGGAWTGSVAAWHGVISEFCVDTGTRCSETRVSPFSAGNIAWIGDSITNGSTTSTPTYPPTELYRIYGQYQSKQVMNFGYLGYGVPSLAPIYADIKDRGFGGLVMLAGVNDLRGGATAATIWASYQPILDDAKSRGWRVTPVYVMPWATWSEWTAAKQTQTDLLNASLQSWCTTNGATCVDTSSLGEPITDGGVGRSLKVAYNYGDGLHLNSAGAAALAALVAAANP